MTNAPISGSKGRPTVITPDGGAGLSRSHDAHNANFKPFGFGGKHVGVMAQEVEKKQPSAVHRGADGMRRVDYAEIR